MPATTILDHVYDHEAAQPDQVFLTQPVGGGQVVDYSWREVVDQARRMAAHLKGLGLPPGARVAMLAKNSAHFFMVDLAVWMAGGCTVAIFPTESAENIRYVLEHSEARVLFVGKLDGWERQAPAVPAALPCIALPLAPPTPFETWDSIVARTQALPGRPARAGDELALLLYTSGSTGRPKGVMQTFGSVTRTAEGIVHEHDRLYGSGPVRVISYLPLAHSYERAWVECVAFVGGTSHVFFSESLATFIDDVKRARPTDFISVPRLWAKFQQSVLAQLPAAQLDALLDDPATAAAVGRKVLAGLGLDAVVRAGSGSAPIAPELVRWYRRLGLNLLEGYAMTEDFAYSHYSVEGRSAPGYVGVAAPGVHSRIDVDGEILIQSPGCMAGYYKQPELTAESFTADGYFRTGDLGEYSADGLLRVTGRKKELFKTGKGKYVAPAPIENRLNAHPMVELSIVSGVGQPAAYAVLVLDENLRPQLGDPELRHRVEAELGRLLQEVNASLPTHERLQLLVVASEPWSVDNGCLTPTMKIKRSRIEAALAPRLEAWLAHPGPVLWA